MKCASQWPRRRIAEPPLRPGRQGLALRSGVWLVNLWPTPSSSFRRSDWQRRREERLSSCAGQPRSKKPGKADSSWTCRTSWRGFRPGVCSASETSPACQIRAFPVSVGCQWGHIVHFAEQYWLPDMDLNHDKQIQSLLCYRYTIGQAGAGTRLGISGKVSSC